MWSSKPESGKIRYVSKPFVIQQLIYANLRIFWIKMGKDQSSGPEPGASVEQEPSIPKTATELVKLLLSYCTITNFPLVVHPPNLNWMVQGILELSHRKQFQMVPVFNGNLSLPMSCTPTKCELKWSRPSSIFNYLIALILLDSWMHTNVFPLSKRH